MLRILFRAELLSSHKRDEISKGWKILSKKMIDEMEERAVYCHYSVKKRGCAMG